MAATLSILYLDKNHAMHEHIGFKSEPSARRQAHAYVADGCTNVVMRCTTIDKNIITTLWSESFDDDTDAPDDANPWQDAINNLITYTIPDLLLDVQRAIIRGQSISADWIESKLVSLDRDLCAIA